MSQKKKDCFEEADKDFIKFLKEMAPPIKQKDKAYFAKKLGFSIRTYYRRKDVRELVDNEIEKMKGG